MVKLYIEHQGYVLIVFFLFPFAERKEHCDYCFYPLSTQQCFCKQKVDFYKRPFARVGCLFETTTEARNIVYHLFDDLDNEIIFLLASLLVLQVSALGIPWCDALVFDEESFPLFLAIKDNKKDNATSGL